MTKRFHVLLVPMVAWVMATGAPLFALDYPVTDFGARPGSGADASAAIAKAIEAAGLSPDNRVVFPEGVYRVERTVFVPAGRHVILEGEGEVTIETTGGMSPQRGMQSPVPYETVLVVDGNRTNVDPFPRQITIRNLNFRYVGPPETRSAVFKAACYLDSLTIEDCDFEGYTHAGTFGAVYATEGVNPRSDAQTMIGRLVCRSNRVVSDDKSTGQNPKSFHFHCPANAEITDNYFWGKGDGYVFRINGGYFDTVPSPDRGAHDIEFARNYVRSDTTHNEYAQITKASRIKIHDNEALATEQGAHNFMDLFNCMDVEFYENIAPSSMSRS